jgi:hypothetical protein
MKLVTLAHVTLNRIGSASTPAVVRHNEVYRVREVPDGSLQTLRELVITIAEENGELPGRLQAMWQENSWNYTPQQPGAVVFNIQGPGLSVQYGAPYAVCYAHPALKIGDRYFKLEEVKF